MNYIYAGTRAYTEAHKLLTENDFERLVTARTAREAIGALENTFLAQDITRNNGDVAGALEDNMRQTKARLLSYIPEPEIANLYWHRFDFFNLSVIEKSKRLKEDHEMMLARLSHLGTIDPELLLTHIEYGKLHTISTFLQDAQSSLQHSDSISLLDSTAEEFYVRYLSSELATKKDLNVRFFISHTIDQFNVQSALRFHKGLHAIFPTAPYVAGGSVYANELNTLEDSLKALSRITNTEFTERDTPSDIEKRLYERMLHVLKRNAYNTFSSAPVLYFMHRFITHIEIVRAIIRSKEALIPESHIRNFIHALS